MKKYLFLSFLFVAGYLHAFNPVDWNYIPSSSYTEVGTSGPIFFSSGTIQIIGVTISSPASNSWIAFFRSTTPVLTTDIATQTLISTDYLGSNNSATFIPMFEMQNDSYTYLSHFGNSKLTIWLRCPRKASAIAGYGTCPGLKSSGQR